MKPWTPHPYQLEGMEKLVTHDYFELFYEPGMGKTATCLGAFSALKAAGKAKRALVIAPLRVAHNVWPSEVKEWEDFSHLRVVTLHGPKKEAMLSLDADIFCINPEGLPWLLTRKNMKLLRADTLIVDEASKFRKSTTKRFNLLKPWLRTFKRRWPLTGTPTPKSLLDLFGIVYLADLGTSLGRFITHYRERYFTTSSHSHDWTLKEGAKDAIIKAITPFTHCLRAEDYLRLPARMDATIKVDLPAGSRAHYSSMEEKLFAQLDSNEILAANAAVATGKLRQICNGALYLPESKDWETLHDEKLDALHDLLEEVQGAGVLVLYAFESDRERILDRFGRDTPWIGGGVSPIKGKLYEDRWNRGELEMLLGHPASMGHGLNLQGGGNHIVWFGPTWDFELYDQAVDRVLRQGSKHQHVHVHHIVAKDTIEEVMLAVLRSRDKEQSSVLDALKSYRKLKVQP